MSVKHTPGPWAWVYDGSGDFSIGEPSDPQERSVANVYAWGRDHDTAEANCRLISAAPDMLEALKAVWFSTFLPANVYDQAVMLQVRAAIEKAEATPPSASAQTATP